jgi:hypothetical protein
MRSNPPFTVVHWPKLRNQSLGVRTTFSMLAVMDWLLIQGTNGMSGDQPSLPPYPFDKNARAISVTLIGLFRLEFILPARVRL